jgi:hypothetical protein
MGLCYICWGCGYGAYHGMTLCPCGAKYAPCEDPQCERWCVAKQNRRATEVMEDLTAAFILLFTLPSKTWFEKRVGQYR